MFTVSVCGGSPVLSGRLFALIKFNRPVWVPSEPEHTGWQQSNADFHYLKLQRPNYIQSNQHWALQRVFIKEVQAEDLNLLSVKNDLIMSWFLTLYVYKAERVENVLTLRPVSELVSRVLWHFCHSDLQHRLILTVAMVTACAKGYRSVWLIHNWMIVSVRI